MVFKSRPYLLKKSFYISVAACKLLSSVSQAESSPFVEKLLKKGYEVVYLTEPVDEYCIQALPEFDGKRFQNVAKEGVKFDESDKAKEKREALEKEFEPLTTWMKDKALKDQV